MSVRYNGGKGRASQKFKPRFGKRRKRGNLMGKRDFMAEHDPTDPYSKHFVRFYKQIVFDEPIQARYLSEWGFDELKKFLKPRESDTGEFLGFDIDEKDKSAYLATRRKLNLF